MTLLQEAIIMGLRANSNLAVAMEATPPVTGNVYEEQGFKVKEATYPRVNVGINSDNPMNNQQIGGQFAGKQNHRVFMDIHIFDNKKTSKRVGAIDQSIRQILEGNQLSYPGLVCCYCEMDSVTLKERDPDTGIWHMVVRYNLVARVL